MYQSTISAPRPRHSAVFRWPRLLCLAIALLFAGYGLTPAPAQKATAPAPPPSPEPLATLAERPAFAPPFSSVRGLTRLIADMKARARKAHKQDEERQERARDRREEVRKEKRERAQNRHKAAKRPPAETEEKEEEEAGTDYLDALLYRLRQRAYPNDRIDPRAYQIAAARRAQMPAAPIGRFRKQGISVLADSSAWQYLGPNNLATAFLQYNGPGPVSGRVNAVAYDPNHPGTYYLGAASGGIWKTTDSGATWVSLADDFPFLQVSSLAVDPTDSNIIYAGTGDFDGYEVYAFGIAKSTDGGKTWFIYSNDDLDFLAVSAILIDPDDHNRITITTGRGGYGYGSIWQSTNGGQTWTSVTSITQVAWSGLSVSAPDTTGKRYYYATGLWNGGYVLRSADRGATWTRLTTPLTPSINNNTYFDQDGVKVATSPTDPNTLYLLGGYDRKIWKSINAGGNWTNITGNLPTGNVTVGLNYNWSQYFYDIVLACSTRTDTQGHPQDVVYAGLVDLAQSTNGGQTWRSIGGPGWTDSALTHVDQHAIAINPNNPNELLIGNDGGLYRLNYNPGTSAWSYQSLNANLGLTQFYALAAHPTSPDWVLGGTQDNGTPAAFNDLQNWATVTGGDGGFCAINPVNPNIQYSSAQFLTLYHTNDNWQSIDLITPPATTAEVVAFHAPVALDKKTPTRLYTATNYLYRWNESTFTWASRLGNQALAGTNNAVLAIAVAPSDSNRLYTGSSDGKLWMSSNAGTTWTQITTGTPSLPNLSITSISVAPSDPNNVLVAFSGFTADRLYQCTNTSAVTRVWTNISGTGDASLPPAPLNAVCRDLNAPATTFFVGSDLGVFYTSDGGAHWTDATQPLGLPNAEVDYLEAVPGTRYLYAATYGRGMWRLPLPITVFLASFTIDPITVRGGTQAQAVITLSAPAPPGGATVLLSSDKQAAQPPANVFVQGGETQVSFTIPTAHVPTLTPVLITATYGDSVQRSFLVVLPSDLRGRRRPGTPLPPPRHHN